MENKRDKILALALTLLMGFAVVLTLVLVKVAPAPMPEQLTMNADEPEIFFTDIEYNDIVADPTPQVDGEPASAAAAPIADEAPMDRGKADDTPTPLTTTTPQPVKTSQTTERKPDPGPTKEEIEDQKRAAIRERMGKSTGLKAQNDAATGSATAGNAAAGNNPGATGLGLDGRKRLNEPDPGIKNITGTFRVKITVNAAGEVVSAEKFASSGFGNREVEVTQACLAASKRLRYSPDDTKPRQQGIITWVIK